MTTCFPSRCSCDPGLSPALESVLDGMAGLSASVTAIARDMMAGLDRLRAGVDAAGSDLKQAIAGEMRRLHDRNSAQADALRTREDEISALRKIGRASCRERVCQYV